MRELERRTGLSDATVRQELKKLTRLGVVDLMVVGTIGLRQLSRQLSGLEAKLGREVNPHILTPEEFARRANEGDHFITTVLKGPRLFVVGGEDELRRLGQ